MNWNISNAFSDEKDFIDLILESRGIEEKEKFLNPPPSAKLIKSMPKDFKEGVKKVKEMVSAAIKNKFPIIVYGDYDTDGICATAILKTVLKEELNHEKTFSYIPSRFEEGYGFSKKGIDECIKLVGKDISETMIITVDAGITAVEAIDYAKEKGFTVVVTDHHQKPEKLPKADAFVWSDELVGAGIAWVLGRELGSSNKKSIAFAALATVTDLQPLVGLNRSVVKEGLKVLNKDIPLGLEVLQKISGREGRKITTYDLGWILGPRINSAGRMGDANESLQLLLETETTKALELARRLDRLNLDRQEKMFEMFKLADIFDRKDLPKIIVTEDKRYHEGIVGLVASRLTQTYYRPSIVMAIEDGLGKASARSIGGIDIISFLRNFEDIFEDVGGHPMAAGFSIKEEKIPLLKENIDKYSKDIPDDLFIPSLRVDLEVPLDKVDIEFLEKVEMMEPFGMGNRRPVFVSRECEIINLKNVGKEKAHISLSLKNQNFIQRAIFFNGASYFENLAVGGVIDVAYTIERNEFNEQVSVNFVIKDLKRV